jgi:tetratricopeptide (TPR) repeat protein
MKVVTFLVYFFYGFTVFSQELLDEHYWISANDYDQELLSKEHFIRGKRLYEISDYSGAIQSFKSSLEIHATSLCYYYYGLALMDIQDYLNAEKAFHKGINGFNNADAYYGPGFYDFWDLYEKDENGNNKEYYFSFYNIACIYSLRNNAGYSFHYLKEAVEHGYPYIDYLLNDPDLKNLFDAHDTIKQDIAAVYNRGFNPSIVSGKNLQKTWAGSSGFVYAFYDTQNINYYELEVWTPEYSASMKHGTYKIKNYTIIITFDNGEEMRLQVRTLIDKKKEYWTMYDSS